MSSTFSQIVLLSLFYGILSIIPQNLTTFTVLSASGVTNTGSTTINGDLGLSPGTSYVGFGAGTGVVTGTTHLTNAVALNAQTNLIAFYSTIANLACGTAMTGIDLGGLTLVPGVYCFTSSATITGTLTLDSQNQTAPVWAFQIASTLTLQAGSTVIFINGNFPCNVFWNVGTAASLGTSAFLQGVVNAYQSISFGTSATATGKMLAQNGALTFISNIVTNCTEAIPQKSCFGRNATDPLICSGSGICISNNTCTCNQNFIGNNCQNFTCFSKNLTDPTVCRGQGVCSGPNNCVCNSGYNGNQCQSPICYTKNATDPTVCNGQGTCPSPNNCVCNAQYNGPQCQNPICYTKNSTDPTVCGGQGTCSSPNNCSCNSQYAGSQCQSPICYTKLSTDPTVCGGQGNCTSPNNCTCKSLYSGTQCQLVSCYGKVTGDPTICSGQGSCSSPNNCVCNSQYTGLQCQTLNTISCFGKLSTDPTVCGGQGTCQSADNCTCNSQYAGPQCQYTVCYSRNTNSTMVCNGRGTCTSPNNCVCQTPYTGTECQISCSNDLTLFAILAGTTITSTGATTITGDIGVAPGISVTGFPPGIITGNQFVGTTVSQNAQVSLIQRYLQISNLPCGTILSGQDLGGKTLFPGVYCFSATAQITGTLTLDSNNDLRAYWVFQVSTALTTSANSKIVMANGGSACNVFWNVGSSATLASSSSFSGNILAYTSISLDSSAVVTGKLLAQNGAVTMISNTITNCPITCATTCYGKSSNDTSVCGGKGTCSFPGYCICQSGTNGTECQTSTRTNSSITSSISIFMLILSLFMM